MTARLGLALRPRLIVGAANDPAEAEADRMAENALAGRAPPGPSHADTPGPRRSVSDQPGLDSLNVTPALPAGQADFELPASEDVGMEKLDGAALAGLETLGGGDAAPDGAPDADIPETEAPEPAVAESSPLALPQRSVGSAALVGPEGGAAPAAIAAQVEHPGPGRPLPAALRGAMETGFGRDFSAVRLHDGARDRAVAAGIGARAFAYGTDLWLGPGESPEDRRLMAHELAHVVQHGVPSLATPEPAPFPAPARARRGVLDGITDQIESVARHVPGYTLLTVILERSPISGARVERTPEALIGGLLGLIPGGTLLYDRLIETRMLEEGFGWIRGELGRLNLSWARAAAAVQRAKDLFSLLSPLDSIRPAFTAIFDDIKTFALAVKDKVLELIIRGVLRLAGPMAEQVWGILQQSKTALKLILEDPLGFAKNLASAITGGFRLFVGNAGAHLKKGLLGFLFGAMQGVGLTLPEKLDLRGIVSIVFQILGLTWANIRALIVKKLGPKADKVLGFIENSVEIIALLLREGIMAVWQKMLGMIENLRQTVIGGIIEFLTSGLIRGALTWLAGLANPIGAIVKIAMAIYEFICAFIERMQQIIELVQSIVASITQVAMGQVSGAAQKIEEAIGRSVPVVLAFLAAVIPVSGITAKIQAIFKKLRAPVEKAITKLVDFVVKKAKKLLAKLIALFNRKQKLPVAAFHIGKTRHRLIAKRKGKEVKLFVRSTEKTVDEVISESKQDPQDAKKVLAKCDQQPVAELTAVLVPALQSAEDKAKEMRPQSATEAQTAQGAALDASVQQAGQKIDVAGKKLAGIRGIETDGAELLRFRVPVTEFEGSAGTHAELSKERKTGSGPDCATPRMLEIDHNPAIAVLTPLKDWAARQAADPPKTPFVPPEGKEAASTPMDFGILGLNSLGRPAGAFPAMAIYASYNGAQSGDDKAAGQKMTSYLATRSPADAPEIRAELTRIIAAKAAAVEALYGKDPQPLRQNVGLGAGAVKALAAQKLNLPAATGAGGQAAPGGRASVEGLTRDFAMSDGNLDFTKVEGKVGAYSEVRENSRRGLLEADHNPTMADMGRMGSWSLGMFMPLSDAELIAALPPGADAGAKVALTARLISFRTEKLADAPYSEGKGGAVTVARDVNQHPAVTASADQATWPDPVAIGQGLWNPAARAQLAAALSAGHEEAARSFVRSLVRPLVSAGLARMILRHNQIVAEVYRTQEKPQVEAANSADATKKASAAAVMDRIIARITETGTTDRLNASVRGWLKAK